MIHVAVCTPEKILQRKTAIALINNTRALGIRTVMLAHEHLWTRYYHCFKTMLLNRFLQKIPDDEIILFTDALDICFINNASEENICNSFRAMEKPVVFSGESNCWPDKLESRFKAGPGPYPFLNSGGFIGYAGALRKITKALVSLMHLPVQRRDDQYTFFLYHMRYPGKIEIDHKARIFQSAFRPSDLEFSGGMIGNIYSDHLPYIIHFNGGKSILRSLFSPNDEITTKIAEHISLRGYRASESLPDDLQRIVMDDYELSSAPQSALVISPHRPLSMPFFPRKENSDGRGAMSIDADLLPTLLRLGMEQLEASHKALRRFTGRQT